MKVGDIVWIKWQPHHVSQKKQVLQVFDDGSFVATHIPDNGHKYRFRPDQIVPAPGEP